MTNKQRYRPNVAMIIVSAAYPEKKEIFLAERNDMAGIWQFPQGGIDNGEEVRDALFREMKEEIGTDNAEIIAEYPEWISYDFPSKIAKSMKPYIGQKQRYFLLKFNEDVTINLETEHPEFSSYKFVDIDDVLGMTAHFKKSVYETVINYFKEEGLL
jgi:putative (di)nucleoside polyphosphate hydrolase